MDFRNGTPHRSEDDTQMNARLMLLAKKKPRAQETRGNSPHRQHLTSFWARVQTKHPGKVSTILPKGVYTRETRDAGNKHPRGTMKEENTLTSYEMLCDLDFDIEFDFKLRRRYCLDSLPPIDDDDDPSKFKLKSVKRVGDIFDDSKFYVKALHLTIFVKAELEIAGSWQLLAR
ncbi:hypothetical protein BGZ57DRAFT_847066 [Hyaloscypha finlandica]|nr:hypothetical protein BGZ57DRAFT_847066 [Hyaloscypha finlandica]